MRVTYLKLDNVAGLMIGSNVDSVEIEFPDNQNSIVSIQGPNGKGKTVLISAIHPFAYVTSLDERSTLSFITPGKNGYKEIHYQDGDDTYVIKHYFKPKGDSHSLRSYFMKNGEELNENGNVRSFNALVEIHFGLTEEMMRLIRLGSNVNSFISLPPARRKEYIGRLIEEIDLYLQLYKGITAEIQVLKAMITANATNVYNCHITDLAVEEDHLSSIVKDIKKAEKERDQLVSEVSRIQSMMKNNDITELRRKHQDAVTSMRELEQLESQIKEHGLGNVTVDQLIAKRSDAVNERVDIQSRINSYRISIDRVNKDIERIDTMIRKVMSNNDIVSLMNNAERMRETIGHTPPIVVNMIPCGATSTQIDQLIHQLNGFNQISAMLYTLGRKPLDIYLKLVREGKSVDKFLKNQQKRIQSTLNQDDIRTLLNQMFGDVDIISPPCETEYRVCPYYRFADTISAIRDKIETDNIDGETLRYIHVIANNIDDILNHLDILNHMSIPSGLKAQFTERKVMERLDARLPLFDISPISEYLSLLREHELFKQNIKQLGQYEQQIAMYRKSGVESQVEQTSELRKQIDFYQRNIGVLTGDLQEVIDRISDLDSNISLVSRYAESIKFRKVFESTVESTQKLLGPLETAEKELQEVRWKLQQVTENINRLRTDHRELDNKILSYRELIKEGEKLKKRMNEMVIIQEAASTRRGIPVLYMKRYLGKIQEMSNELLDLIYDGELRLGDFYISADTFEIPYIKNQTTIPDVKYASQSEIALMTMALSFSLMTRATGTYNVLLLDEIEAGLDDDNRAAFLKMLQAQMMALHAEQVFIISHNMSQMVNIPMDCICFGDRLFKSKLQNVIYQL